MKSWNSTGRTALLCIASLCVASTPSNVAAQRYGHLQSPDFQSLGEHVLASHGWLIATYGNNPVNVLVVELETGDFHTLVGGAPGAEFDVGVSGPAHGFAALENTNVTTALLVGTMAGYEINMTSSVVEANVPRPPRQAITVFGVADLGSDVYNVGGFAADTFYWLNGQLGGPIGEPVSIAGANLLAGIAGGDNSVIVGTVDGPLRVDLVGVSELLVAGSVTALVGNSQRGRALVYLAPAGTSVLARIMNNDSVVTIETDIEGTPTSPDELVTAEGMVMWVDRSNAMAPVIRVAAADSNSVSLTIEMPVDGLVVDEPALWATLIATDGDYLVAASPMRSHLDLFDLRCYPDSGRECPTGSACSMGSNHCLETDPGVDAGPSDPDAGPSFDAGPGVDAGSTDAGGDTATSEMDASPPESREPRAELSCTCRAAGASSSGPLPFAFAGLLCLTIARRRRS